MDCERLDKWCEWVILGLLLTLLGLGPLAIGAVRAQDFLWIQGLTVAAGALWLIRLWLVRSHRLLWPPVCWAVLAVVGYALVRYATSDIEYVARQELIKVLVYAWVFFLILNNLHHQESAQVIAFFLIFLGMAIAMYALFQTVTGSDRIWHFVKPAQYLRRGSGTYICPNHLAGFLEMLLPLGLAYVFLGRLKPVTKVVLGYAALVMLAGIAVTVSRGGWVATVLALAIFFGIILRRRAHRLPALVFLILLLAAGIGYLRHTQHGQHRFQELAIGNEIEGSRFWFWRPAIQLWQENVWWGIGLGHFDNRYPQYRPETIQVRPEFVHNDYLNTLTDWGVVGLVLVAGAWVLVGAGVFKTWKYVHRQANDLTVKSSNRSAFVLGGTMGLVAILAHSVVDFNMHIPANALVAVALLALLSGHLRFATERYWVRTGWLVRGAITVLGLLGLGYLSLQGWRLAREYQCLNQPEYRTGNITRKIAILEQAHAIEPMNFQTVFLLGELLRLQSWEGNDDYRALAEEALKWFAEGMRLNPYDGYEPLRYGMCLHWLGRHAEAGPYFDRALRLEVNSAYMVAHMGWHWVQLRDYAAAKPWFERSLALRPWGNPIAQSYLEIVKRKLAEAAGKP